MSDLLLTVFVFSLAASTIGMFWAVCLMPHMIFGGLGDKIRYKLDEKEDCHGEYKGWMKLLKGLQCPYCVSIWVLIVIHVWYWHFFEDNSTLITLSIFMLLFAMGLTTLINKITSVFINQNLKL